MVMQDPWVPIAENRKVNGKYYKLVFHSNALARGVKPGQFVNVLLSPSTDPFLRRPFSYYRVLGGRIEILYEILGKGTALLSRKKAGEELKVLGPLGNSFRTKLPKNKKRVLVAGGVGVPPLVFLAEHFPAAAVLIGTKSRDEVLPKKEIAKIKGPVFYSTNDGSYGAKGFVTGLLNGIIQKEKPENLFIQTCGPKPMMQAVFEIARKRGIEGEASIDNTMACGVGACLGCMVKTPQGWVPSCTEGPVFDFKRIVEI